MTDYVKEEYQVAKKVPVTKTVQVPYQVASTTIVQEEYTEEELEAYTVER